MWLLIMNMFGWTHTFEYITLIQDQNIWSQISRFFSILFGIVVSTHSCFGDRDNSSIIKSGIFGTVIAMALLWQEKNMSSLTISYILTRIREKIQYQEILDNLEESIVILENDDQIDFVNDKFLG